MILCNKYQFNLNFCNFRAYTGDLMVKLHDNNGIDIGETLGWLEMVEMKPKIVPSSTELPG